MGQRRATETLFKIIAAFIDRPTWKQAELARELGTSSETVRRHLGDLVEGGLKLEREEDHPHVYWSVRKNWLPGAVAFKGEEAMDLLRLLGRAPPGALRNRLIAIAVDRLTRAGLAPAFDPSTIQPAPASPEEEANLALIEDALAKKVALRMRYYTASKGRDSRRHVSVHRIDAIGARPQFIATCHVANELRRFRVSNVSEAKLDSTEPFRPTTKDALAKLDRESFGGFRDVGPVVRCAFFVRDPEAYWVARNLPDDNIAVEDAKGGSRFVVETAGVLVLARFVAGLGEVARPETKELAAEVRAIAQAALANATR
ncbi:MAG: WYL domain-containing protein [Labilithrix sp.]|nr:WYL domain-containing protein [Labilithrix sp.]MCW5815782.1 WYL domain-containing protein [Labilithrix sp.]